MTDGLMTMDEYAAYISFLIVATLTTDQCAALGRGETVRGVRIDGWSFDIEPDGSAIGTAVEAMTIPVRVPPPEGK